MSRVVVEFVELFLTGLLAGEEFVVRWGVHPALSALPDRSHIEVRLALVRRLRVLVPAIILPTVVVGGVVLALAPGGPGCVLRWAGGAALAAFVLLSSLGTVPINIRVNEWDPASPPAQWRDIVRRWVLFDTFRSTAALVAFACFLIGVSRQMSGG
jgi:uncharacterized membrane protein